MAGGSTRNVYTPPIPLVLLHDAQQQLVMVQPRYIVNVLLKNLSFGRITPLNPRLMEHDNVRFPFCDGDDRENPLIDTQFSPLFYC